MRFNNTTLGVVVVVLAVISIFSYRQSVSRAERFERGQKFLAQLNPDNISEIEIKKDGETVVLRKNDEGYVVASRNNYPAKTEAVNRFINDTLNVGLEKKVGSGESLEKELETVAGGSGAREFTLKNDAGKTMVHFVVGKAGSDGRGSYIKRLDDEDDAVYLTSRSVSLSSNEDTFLDKEIVDAPSADVVKIVGKDYVFEKGESELALKDVPNGKQESANAGQVRNLLSNLRYDKVFLADDSEVQGLAFGDKVEVFLGDDSFYVANIAKKDEAYYLKITAGHQIDRIGITREESDEELEKKSETLKRMDEVRVFAEFHGSWVYKLTEYVGKKFGYAKADLIEDEPKEEESEDG